MGGLFINSSKRESTISLFAEWRREQHTLLMSAPMLTEFLSVCQKSAARNTGIGVSKAEREDIARKEGGLVYKGAVSIMMAERNVRLLPIWKINMQNIFLRAHQIIWDTGAPVNTFDDPSKRRGFDLMPTSIMDIIHVLFARQSDCDEFHTFDKGIRDISSHEMIRPMRVVIH
ncbi:MAG: hypothetical protein MPJ04_07980 [Nitrosopumilus sp.]|nr:hypothetical protein [Nitrosopumilus sp.]MDA7954821.1 hypothetical protein [Nitrosopumilus sp.]